MAPSSRPSPFLIGLTVLLVGIAALLWGSMAGSLAPSSAGSSSSGVDPLCKAPAGTTAEAVDIIKDVAKDEGFSLGTFHTVRDADLDVTFIAAQATPVKNPNRKATAVWANPDGVRFFASINSSAEEVTKGGAFARADETNAAAMIAASCVKAKP